MVKAKNFEELIIWQKARGLVVEIYNCTAVIKDYSFNDQIQRAVISVMNNIAEGSESGSILYFKKFLKIAKGSCGEVRSMLYAAMDLKYIQNKKAETLIEECRQLAGGISRLITYLDQKK